MLIIFFLNNMFLKKLFMNLMKGNCHRPFYLFPCSLIRGCTKCLLHFGPKNLSANKFCVQKNFRSKIFLGQIFVSKIILSPKKRKFGPKKILGRKILGLKRFWVQKNFGSKKLGVAKKFGSTNNFWSKKILG